MRIPLAGGGTDFPAWVKDNGGYVITAGIDRYVYLSIHDVFTTGYTLRYGMIEHADAIDDIQHPIFREALRLFDIPPHVEVSSLADIPAGTGLGSSGAFTVGLVKALCEYRGEYCSRDRAAQVASVIELEILGRPGGRQDQYACAYGGVQGLAFKPSGSVYADPIVAHPLIEQSLSLFFTGFSRDADIILFEQSMEGLDLIQGAAWAASDAIVAGDVHTLGGLMNAHWQLKRLRAYSMSNQRVDELYARGVTEGGAIGGKLVGAGGGGFLLFVTEDRERLSSVLGVPEVPVVFDTEGCVIL